MRYRQLDANLDMTFGAGSANFFINDIAAVAQLILTRLKLLTGEWFLDTTEGTPYATEVMGTHTELTYDLAIRQRILGTQGVTGIAAYSSSRNPQRGLSISAAVNTIFGPTTIKAVV